VNLTSAVVLPGYVPLDHTDPWTGERVAPWNLPVDYTDPWTGEPIDRTRPSIDKSDPWAASPAEAPAKAEQPAVDGNPSHL
jgi:hypothetical protein